MAQWLEVNCMNNEVEQNIAAIKTEVNNFAANSNAILADSLAKIAETIIDNVEFDNIAANSQPTSKLNGMQFTVNVK